MIVQAAGRNRQAAAAPVIEYQRAGLKRCVVGVITITPPRRPGRLEYDLAVAIAREIDDLVARLAEARAVADHAAARTARSETIVEHHLIAAVQGAEHFDFDEPGQAVVLRAVAIALDGPPRLPDEHVRPRGIAHRRQRLPVVERDTVAIDQGRKPFRPGVVIRQRSQRQRHRRREPGVLRAGLHVAQLRPAAGALRGDDGRQAAIVETADVQPVAQRQRLNQVHAVAGLPVDRAHLVVDQFLAVGKDHLGRRGARGMP